MLATVAGVLVGGVAATTVAAGTTAALVGAAIGGGIACWWFDDGGVFNVGALPRKSALRGPAANQAPEAVLVNAAELRIVPARR